MIITCQNQACSFDINIEDGNIPDKPIRIICPRCKTPNTVYPPKTGKAVKGEAGASSGPSPDQMIKEDILASVDERLAILRREILSETRSYKGEQEGEQRGENQTVTPERGDIKKALICDDEAMVRRILKDSISSLGFISDEAPTVEDAVRILKNPEIGYDLVLVDKVFPDDPEGGYKILAQLASLPLDIRRRIYVAFVSGDIKTRDSGTAFLLGANTVVNKKDLSKIAPIVEEDMKDYEKLYMVFNRCLRSSSGGRHIQ